MSTEHRKFSMKKQMRCWLQKTCSYTLKLLPCCLFGLRTPLNSTRCTRNSKSRES